MAEHGGDDRGADLADDVEMDELEAAYDENCLATIVRQKALLERAHAVITELLAYDARTMDLNKLSMLTAGHTPSLRSVKGGYGRCRGS